MIPKPNNRIRNNRIPNEAHRSNILDLSRPGQRNNSLHGNKNYRRNNNFQFRRDDLAKDNPDAKKEITAGVIVFRRTVEGLKYLLLYHRGQYWNFPKGHVEKEERSLDAALRETSEETGLKKSDLKLMPGFKEYERFYFKKGKETIFKVVIIYLAETREPRIKISYEHQGYAWFLYREARQIFGRYKDNQKVLERAHKFIMERQK